MSTTNHEVLPNAPCRRRRPVPAQTYCSGTTKANLRNAPEHLDETLIDDVEATAMAGDNPEINRSLRRLPGAQLRIDVSGSLLFELIGSSDIERRARAVATTADRLMQEAEDRAVEYGRPDTPDDEQGGDYD